MKKCVMVLILCSLMVFTAITGYSAPASAALRIGTDLNSQILTNIIAAPSQLTAEADGTAVTLTWIDNSANETTFDIERKVARGIFEPIATVRSGNTSYVNTGLQAGTQYVYRVRAMTSTAASPYSNEASVTISESVSFDPNIQIDPDLEPNIDYLIWGYDVVSGKATITKYKGVGGDVTVPSTLGEVKVTRIDSQAFEDCAGLTSIVVPNSVTSIGMDTFRGCNKLKKVTLPDTITSIGLDCFAECSSLSSINLPPGLSEIELGTFNGCSSLTDIAIPANVMTIEIDAFFNCTGLTAVTLPKSLSQIDPSAFRGCSNLTTFSIAGDNPSFTTTEGILYSKDKATLLVYPDGKITGTVILADHVKSIGPTVFQAASNLKEIVFPSGLTSIGNQAFYGTGLTSVTIPATVKTIGLRAFAECASLKTVRLPSTLITIESGTFSDCTSLTGVTMVNGVQTIGIDAFNGCSSLKEIYLPSTIKTIGIGAFQKCPAFKSMWFYGYPPNIDSSALDFTYDEYGYHDYDVTLYYPRALEDSWKDYGGEYVIVPFDPLNTNMLQLAPGIALKDLVLPGQLNGGQIASGQYPGPLPDGSMSIKLSLGKTDFGVNGQSFALDASPMILESRMMLPVRYVAEPLGAVTDWNQAEQKVTVTLNNTIIELWIGKSTAKINGVEVLIDPDNQGVKPVIVPPGRTMLPLRFVGEALECEVGWDPVLQQATLTRSK
ncbi:MAG TPA: leucine-rich repeat protein [Syntrophomonadaceae bacterium]|nr:leucine-rich repeat protein [Syntrophomonadaceae bacterium]HPR94373.1 leucine-rich repeat protein [Syntrophomonadaceae bacterium]